jgi:uncharacterized protein YdeI (YjbR/CyaY-like superfamily)
MSTPLDTLRAMADLTPHDIGWFASPAELREWLDAHHATEPEKWVGMRPKSAGLPTVSWEDVVDEVLCVGWIDGIRKKADGGSVIRITPRRQGSIWSARNVARVEALRADGRMRDAGEAAFAARRADRTAVYSFERTLALDEPAEAALRADAGGWTFWEAQPAGYRRLAIHWVMSAKRAETRERRLARLVEACAKAERVPEVTGAPRPAGSTAVRDQG